MTVTKGLRQLTTQTIVAYVRMAATVVIAVVVRICLDSIGIVVTRQQAEEAGFWFAHCRRDGGCVLAGITLFFISLGGCSLFAWSCQEWITDPMRNPYARRFSFEIVVEAATWIPISVVVGKTNAVVEWSMQMFMDIAKDNRRAAPLLSSSVAALLTLLCALLTHVAMKHCNGVQRSAQEKEAGMKGFGKFFLLATLYCLGWAVGWSNWELVLSLMDALEPGTARHPFGMAAAVIFPLLFCSICIYLRYGPEPIIPDPRLQQLCYSHGYSNSVGRALVSYVVYSCVVFLVMFFCDPTYGIFIVLVGKAYVSVSDMDNAGSVVVLCAVASVVTLFAAVGSAAITWAFDVDEMSSTKLSRSVHKACKQMVKNRRSDFDIMLQQVQRDGSDARFVRAAYSERFPPAASSPSDEGPEEEEDPEGRPQAPPYIQPEASGQQVLPGLADSPNSTLRMEIESERQLRLNPRNISRGLCASILAYDVLGLVVCFQWGAIVVRTYSVVFGNLAGIHDALYVISCVVYAATVMVGVSRFVFAFFPSAAEENRKRSFAACPDGDESPLDDAGIFQRLGAGLLQTGASAREFH